MHASVKNEFLAKIEELSHGLPSNPLDQMVGKSDGICIDVSLRRPDSSLRRPEEKGACCRFVTRIKTNHALVGSILSVWTKMEGILSYLKGRKKKMQILISSAFFLSAAA